jgi:hypothetical protein
VQHSDEPMIAGKIVLAVTRVRGYLSALHLDIRNVYFWFKGHQLYVVSHWFLVFYRYIYAISSAIITPELQKKIIKLIKYEKAKIVNMSLKFI